MHMRMSWEGPASSFVLQCWSTWFLSKLETKGRSCRGWRKSGKIFQQKQIWSGGSQEADWPERSNLEGFQERFDGVLFELAAHWHQRALPPPLALFL
jgi:hypothetical protein